MVDSREKDRNNLREYDLDVNLFEEFNLQVKDVIPIRKVFMLITDKGNMILKKIDYSIEELNFISSAMEYIKNNNFSRIIEFVPNRNGEFYLKWGENLYCVMKLVEGGECEFSNPVHLVLASRGLSELHLASRGFKSSFKEKNNMGKLINSFYDNLEKMQLFKNVAKMHCDKNEFDRIFLENVDYFQKHIKESIRILERSSYKELCKEEHNAYLCHHDLAHHNVLIKDEKAYFIDFDYAVIDLKSHDLCNYINKVVKRFAFEIDKAAVILDEYNKKNNIDKKELEVLYGMLVFPQDFYSISRDYYERRKGWEESTFIEKLINKASYKGEREEFLNKFSKYL